jgi:Spy/CpxP family protein refolding chaperone
VPPFERTLFSPELVMQHQSELALTPEQRRSITDAVKSLQNHTVDLQWNLQAEQTELARLLEQRPVQEQAAIAQLNKLMDLEASVKRAHLATLTRIKNVLTDRQVQQLTELRGRHYELRDDGALLYFDAGREDLLISRTR